MLILCYPEERGFSEEFNLRTIIFVNLPSLSASGVNPISLYNFNFNLFFSSGNISNQFRSPFLFRERERLTHRYSIHQLVQRLSLLPSIPCSTSAIHLVIPSPVDLIRYSLSSCSKSLETCFPKLFDDPFD